MENFEKALTTIVLIKCGTGVETDEATLGNLCGGSEK
jgi:hypothetical protein